MLAPRMRLGLVGLGRWGEKLARVFAKIEQVELTSVCDVSRTAQERAQKWLPGVRVTRSLGELVSRERPDAVVIATPPVTHARLGLEALEAGLDVFLEKPMTLCLPDARALEHAAQRSGRLLMIGHILEYHPAVTLLRQRIRRGDLGNVRLILSERLGPSANRHENVWWSLAPHDLSLLRHLSGVEPRAVQVRGGEEMAIGRVEASDGLVALMQLSFAAREKVRRTVVVGSEAGAVFEDGARVTLRTFPIDEKVERAMALGSCYEPAATLDGVAPSSWLPAGGTPISVQAREPLLCEAEHFVRAVLGHAPVLSDGRSGRRVVAALEAGHRSLALGGRAQPVARD